MSLYSLRSAPRQQSKISIPLSAKFTTLCPVREQVRNYGIREIGCTWLSRQKHMYAPHMQQLLVDNGSSSNQVPSFTKISVSCIFRSFIRDPDEYDAEIVDLAAELGIPDVPRGEPGSTKGISFIINLETKKAEELLGLTQATPLKDVVAVSVEDFKARGYPGFTA